ncbi:hypothetical protein DPMN_020419 [Dreissena polymorpha]|uniref:Uncharacterized protein n=1 Tax=Dreissena polymorpha TaxID=45954 RepID=A0A9D4NL09_DREPO|nr:hypothetical protein DPMN_020419 [Dreissena polymorpha]
MHVTGTLRRSHSLVHCEGCGPGARDFVPQKDAVLLRYYVIRQEVWRDVTQH